MEWNMEGFIDRYGQPVFNKPEEEVLGVDGEYIYTGAIDYWEAEVESLKKDADALNEFTDSFLVQNLTLFEMKAKEVCLI